ncbi:MAG: sulfatase-like hydrolase/transferase [Sphingomonadaceae bacterium]
MGFTIDRRQVLGGIGAAGALATGSPLLAKPGKRDLPNIVFIMADDLGYADLGCTGSRNAKTPHIDSIAANGLLLTQGYANSCICSPTRTGLLSGCYQYRFPVGLEEPLGPWAPPGIGFPKERRTIAEALKAQGYETALVGKWHLGSPPDNDPLKHGYDQFFGIIEGGADYFRHRPVMGGRDIGPMLRENESDIERVGYLTDIFGDEAVKRIREKRKPLFLSLHFTAPHWPWEGREDEEVSRQLKSFFHYDGGNLETYKRMVEAMDDNVGKVLAALRETGEIDNTIIVFTSDNGGERFSDVWPFTGAKSELLEGGIRVPILMQWPGHIAPGSTSSQVMISMDFLPTFLAITGGKAGVGEFDGLDLSPQLLGGATAIERTLFWRMKANGQAAVRQGDWKYLKLGGKEHLFNLAQDERERAILNDKHPEKLRELKLAWDEWNRQMLPYPLGSFSGDNKESWPDRY